MVERVKALAARYLPGDDPAFHRNVLLSIVILLMSIGTVMVFSASYYQKGVSGDAFFFLRRHLLWLPIAALAGLVVYQFDYRFFARWYLWIYALTILLLLLVLIPGVGMKVNQSRRWLPLGSLQFQPSELAKLAAIIFVAGFFSHDLERLKKFWRGYATLSLGLLGLFGLVLLEPDFGTAMFTLGLSGILVLLSGVRRFYLLSSVILFCPLISTYVYFRWDMIKYRLFGFLEPESVYQIKHSLLALGNGGWFGLGLGAGTQKLRYLPEPYTDFIFSVLGEEMGYVGSVVILLLFVALLWASVGVARRAPDYFSFLLASGITLALALQAATNIAVVTASVPTKGIPLPFLTFGGSGMCMTFAQIGILLSIDRRRIELEESASSTDA